ncbi:MAG: efflux RND transporter periplasmic adaptor subunit [Alphaproteobacteria bacterium]|nr:efflux RND transporter periplasmic adaptor subunit [Alphaproteobacteria bacterium]
MGGQTSQRTLVVLFAGLLTACGPSETQETKNVAPPIPVSTTTVARETRIEPIIGTGTIAALRTTDVGPSVDGIIEEVFVRVGARVTKGQPLFRTRDTELKLKVEELAARVALAEAEARNAARELERFAKLGRTGAASQGRVDDAKALAQVTQAQLKVAEAQLAQAKQLLEDAIVVAPYDAVVTRRDVDEGRFMATRMGGGMSGASSGVVQIMQIDVVGAIVQVPETELGRLALGQKARLTVAGLDDIVPAKVDVINDRVDPTTRGVEVRLAVANPDYAIKPGTFVRAEIDPEGRSVLVLARSAVLGTGASRYVFQAEDNAAKRVPVQVRELDAATIEIVSGLSEGAVVLTGPGIQRLYDGAPIERIAPEGVALKEDAAPASVSR